MPGAVRPSEIVSESLSLWNEHSYYKPKAYKAQVGHTKTCKGRSAYTCSEEEQHAMCHRGWKQKLAVSLGLLLLFVNTNNEADAELKKKRERI